MIFRKGPPCWPLNSGPLFTSALVLRQACLLVKCHIQLWTRPKMIIIFFFEAPSHRHHWSTTSCVSSANSAQLFLLSPAQPLVSFKCLLAAAARPRGERASPAWLPFPKTLLRGGLLAWAPTLSLYHGQEGLYLIRCVFLVTFYEYFRAKLQINSMGLICHWKS